MTSSIEDGIVISIILFLPPPSLILTLAPSILTRDGFLSASWRAPTLPRTHIHSTPSHRDYLDRDVDELGIVLLAAWFEPKIHSRYYLKVLKFKFIFALTINMV